MSTREPGYSFDTQGSNAQKYLIKKEIFETMFGHYCTEKDRIATFQDWPHDDSSSTSRTNMARAGFYSCNREDYVCCFVCFVTLSDWEPEDDPFVKHLEESPNCLFAKFGKPERSLTTEQFVDVMCARSLNMLDRELERFLAFEDKILNDEYDETEKPVIEKTNGYHKSKATKSSDKSASRLPTRPATRSTTRRNTKN